MEWLIFMFIMVILIIPFYCLYIFIKWCYSKKKGWIIANSIFLSIYFTWFIFSFSKDINTSIWASFLVIIAVIFFKATTIEDAKEIHIKNK